MKQPLTFSNFLLLLTAVILLLTVLPACGTAEPEKISLPQEDPGNNAAAAAETDQPDGDASLEDVLLQPTATPKPTATPDVVTELISQISNDLGIRNKTILRISAQDWIDLAISLGLVFLIGSLLSRLVIYLLRKLFPEHKNQYANTFIKEIRRQITLIILVIGFEIGTSRLAFLDSFLKIRLSQLYTTIIVVALTIILWRLLDVLVVWFQNEVEPQRDQHQVDTILVLLHRAGRTILIIVSVITLLSLYNINVNALVAALGIGGLALSLSAQDTLTNVISGIMIMLDQPFRVGDRIEIKGLGTWGDVLDIGLRSTRIRTLDNRMVIIPNNTISGDQIINYAYPDPRYRIQIEIGIGYGQDIEKVRRVLVETVEKVEGVLSDQGVDALYERMGDSAMVFRVRWWIHSYVDTRRMFDRVNTALQQALDQEGINCPFNTLDINVLNMPPVRMNSSHPPEQESGSRL